MLHRAARSLPPFTHSLLCRVISQSPCATSLAAPASSRLVDSPLLRHELRNPFLPSGPPHDPHRPMSGVRKRFASPAASYHLPALACLLYPARIHWIALPPPLRPVLRYAPLHLQHRSPSNIASPPLLYLYLGFCLILSLTPALPPPQCVLVRSPKPFSCFLSQRRTPVSTQLIPPSSRHVLVLALLHVPTLLALTSESPSPLILLIPGQQVPNSLHLPSRCTLFLLCPRLRHGPSLPDSPVLLCVPT